MNVFQWIGSFFRKAKLEPNSIESVFLTIISGEPFDVYSLSDDEKGKLLKLLDDEPGHWMNRYPCRECGEHVPVTEWMKPCQKCGGNVSYISGTYRWYSNYKLYFPRTKYMKVVFDLRVPKEYSPK